jgi:hypothetical protein
VYLDGCLGAQGAGGRFVVLLDAAVERVLREDTFTKYGRE